LRLFRFCVYTIFLDTSLQVSLVIWFSPVSENVVSKGGYAAVISSSGFFKPPTFFIGLGVLSFAYVCQHASFVIAGSLQNPTNDRWSKVTKSAVITCGTLLTSCGVIGYLGFQDGTQGNILNSFLSYPNEATTIAANIARGLLCCAVFFVYPIELWLGMCLLSCYLKVEGLIVEMITLSWLGTTLGGLSPLPYTHAP
jgi:sodium-coupled neutral amino acid transporter 11